MTIPLESIGTCRDNIIRSCLFKTEQIRVFVVYGWGLQNVAQIGQLYLQNKILKKNK